MSVNAYLNNIQGAAISWKPSTGTYLMTCSALASTSARQGAKGDLASGGTAWAQRWAGLVNYTLGAAVTNGNAVELYWAPSPTSTAGTDNPGGANGTDAAFATPAEYKLQLLFLGNLNPSNNAGTGTQIQEFEFFPPTQYGMPVIVNSSGQTFTLVEFRIWPIEQASTTTFNG